MGIRNGSSSLVLNCKRSFSIFWHSARKLGIITKMSKFLITGGKKLEGEINIAGNKNSALKLIPATLLTDKKSTLTNVPDISDVRILIEIIQKLGVKTNFDNGTLEIDPSSINSYE